MIEPFNATAVVILTAGFFLATVLGVLTSRAKLSPIPGYLIAGYLIGPYSPGFVADVHVAEQLAEIGVILMLFNVGLHIKIIDLINVKSIAVPGAIFQILASTTAGAVLIYALGGNLASGIIFGIAISVASTMIMIKMLTDNKLLHTQEGHISIGWLIVEDLITVLFLILIPVLAIMDQQGELSFFETSKAMGYALLMFVLLVLFMMTIGKQYVSFLIKMILKTHSKELLTLGVLAITFQIAIGSAYFFGTSIALGAFIAGVVMGQMPSREEVSRNGESLKDIFSIIFFLAIGMLFNPIALFDNWTLFFGTVAIVLLVKPVAAYMIIRGLKYPAKTALLVSIALAQIGEFSFIVVEQANRVKLLPDEGYDIIIAAALLSIAINPLLFKWYKHRDLATK